MDWLAGSRQHILELLITRTLVLAPIYVLGFSKEVIDAYIVIVGFQAVFNHANVSVRLGPLRYVIVTPNFHHWHHSQDDEAIDRNYAAHFAFLDHLFGTAVKRRPPWPDRYGVVGDYVPERLPQAARVSVRLEGLSAATTGVTTSTSSIVGAGAAGLYLRRHRRPARPARAAARPCGQGGREDPHLRRRPLQLHQPRVRARRTSCRDNPDFCRSALARYTPRDFIALVRPPRHRLAREAPRPAVLRRLGRADHRHAAGRMRRRRASQRWQPCAVHERRARGRPASSSTPTRGSGRRGAARRGHRRAVDPEDRRHRLRLPRWRASSATRVVETAPGPGAADLRRRDLGAASRRWPACRWRSRIDAGTGKASAALRRGPAVHAPRPERPGGAADLELLARRRRRCASTWRPGTTWPTRCADAKAQLAAPARQPSWRSACRSAWPTPGCARAALGRHAADAAGARPRPRRAGRRPARLADRARRHRGLAQGRGHARRRRHARARLASSLREPPRARACTSSARWST